jgi:hypothetical protein
MADTKHEVPFNRGGKVTKATNGYAGFDGEAFNGSEKNSSISRLDMVGKKTANSGTAYNGKPINQTYMPATSNGVPEPQQVCYQDKEKSKP